MVTEFWSGWFDHWGEKHHRMTTESFVNLVSSIFRRNASINFYMFVGGTNFGFWNGANHQAPFTYAPTITSYDYDAPIAEDGEFTEKAHALRKVLEEFELQPVDWPQVPESPSKAAYGEVRMEKMITLDKLVAFAEDDTQEMKNVVPMEYLEINNGGGQGYGYLLYRNTIQRGGTLQIDGNVTDRAQLFVNFKEFGSTDWTHTSKWVNPEFSVPDVSGQTLLDILVENCGRVNYSREKILNVQRKGITGNVFLNGAKLENWMHIPLEFSDAFLTQMHNSDLWVPFAPVTMPAVYRGYLNVRGTPKDTFMSLKGWEKGAVFVNGHNLGRYWTTKGPQQTLYVPAPILVSDRNEIVVFEQYAPRTNVLTFVDKHVLG